MEQAQEQEQQALPPVEQVRDTQQAKASMMPVFPNWPTSKPGPHVSEAPPGQTRVAARSDQTTEIHYNQETGEPGIMADERTEPAPSMQGRVSTEQEQSLRQRRKRRQDL